MKISKKIIYTTLAFLTVLVIGFILFFQNDDSIGQVETQNVNYNKLDEIIFDVSTSKAFMGDLIIKISANGKIRAARELEVSSNSNAIIREINIYEGKRVKKEDLLVKLDDREYQIALKEAEEQLMSARVEYGLLKKDLPNDTSGFAKAKDYERELKLIKKGFKKGEISKNEYIDKRDDLEMKLIFTGAKREEFILNKSGVTRGINAREKAKLNIEHTEIRAEFDGEIGAFELVSGMRVSTGKLLLKLFDIKTLKIDVNILENEISKIKLNNYVKVEIPAIPEEEFYGTVKRISPFINSEDGTCKVEIEIKNKNGEIKPGMFAKVLIETNTLSNRLLVKKDALLVRDKRNLVFVVEDSLAKWKYVKIGNENENFFEILDGVKKDDNVIVRGHYNLAHDSKVKVTEWYVVD